jgi:transcriptional regulator GlxA family with amidase domain
MTKQERISNDTPPNMTPEIVPKGAYCFPVDRCKPTKHLGFLLLPEFTLLAFGAALDPLRVANQLAQQPLYHWTVFSETGEAVVSSSGVEVAVTSALENIPKDLRLLVCSGNQGVGAASEKTVATLRRHARFGGKLGGICTGAATLARAGLLKDQSFTLHWENQPGFVEKFPTLAPTANRFEIDGDFWTCGGGAAAAEMMLAIIQRDYGRDFAVVVSDMCLNGGDFEARTTQRSSFAYALSTRHPKLIQVIKTMHQFIEEPLSLDELSLQTKMSRRQIERHFRQFLNESPMTTYRNLRLDRARSLLIETEITVTEVAAACGFNSTGVFSRHYRARFGISPSAHLQQFKVC